MQRLLDDAALERSSVVAHRFMNRERILRGGNGYVRELRLDPVRWLADRVVRRGRGGWLDLCCGRGLALFEAWRELEGIGVAERVTLRGVDLVPGRTPHGVEIVEASLHQYDTADRFDLVTCVHGLHYVGDKLGLLARAAAWLVPDGMLVATFDLGTLRLTGDRSARRQVPRALRERGFEIDTRRHLVVRRRGGEGIAWPWRYLGADDTAGPGFTGENAVASYYE